VSAAGGVRATRPKGLHENPPATRRPVSASDLLGGSGDDSCLSAADGQDDDSVPGGSDDDTFRTDAGDFVSTVENGPTPCEGG
jgi:hypothetical protein